MDATRRANNCLPFFFFSDNCEVRTHLDSYELLTVICEELSDTIGYLQHVALNISECTATIKIVIKAFLHF